MGLFDVSINLRNLPQDLVFGKFQLELDFAVFRPLLGEGFNLRIDLLQRLRQAADLLFELVRVFCFF